jgi:tryptophan synthase beta chain
MTQYCIGLDAAKMPDAWYNIIPDLPAPLPPPLQPGNKQPLNRMIWRAIPAGLIEQRSPANQ